MEEDLSKEPAMWQGVDVATDEYHLKITSVNSTDNEISDLPTTNSNERKGPIFEINLSSLFEPYNAKS